MTTPPPTDLPVLLLSGYRYALSLTHQRAQAEDLLQDAWVAILQARGPHTRPYLFTAIRSRFLNQHRRERLVPMIPLDDSTHEWDNDARAPDDEVTLRADPEELERALATLRPVERETLYLATVEEYTAQEIADLTRMARGTVLSLLHRTRQKLRRMLNDDHKAEANA